MSTTLDQVVDTLKEQLRADPSIMQIVVEKVVAASQGNKPAARWLRTTAGQLWLDAAVAYVEDGGKISYPT